MRRRHRRSCIVRLQDLNARVIKFFDFRVRKCSIKDRHIIQLAVEEACFFTELEGGSGEACGSGDNHMMPCLQRRSALRLTIDINRRRIKACRCESTRADFYGVCATIEVDDIFR